MVYASTSVRSFVHLHSASLRKKFHNFKDGKMEVHYGNIFLNPHEGVIIPAKVYKDHRETTWLSWWFNHKVGTDSWLKSSCQKPAFTLALEVALDYTLCTCICTI